MGTNECDTCGGWAVLYYATVDKVLCVYCADDYGDEALGLL